MELLSFRNITENEEAITRELISECKLYSLTMQIKEKAIFLRRKYAIKLPDSIIAATAVCCKVPLISADKGLKKIQELELQLIEPIMQ